MAQKGWSWLLTHGIVEAAFFSYANAKNCKGDDSTARENSSSVFSLLFTR